MVAARSALRKVFAIVGVLLAPALAQAQAPGAPASTAACNWVDGSDPNGPKNDAGRGVTDWNAHQQYVAAGAGLGNAHALVGARIATLKSCLDRDGYARLYADLSVLIGQYGRAHAGWVDGFDPAAPKDDGGRGIGNWAAHRDYVTNGVGSGNANALVASRLQALGTRIPRETYARLYADVSVLIAKCARGTVSAAPAPTPAPKGSGKKVLVVDDSKAMRMIVMRMLRQAGFGDHEFIEAGNGSEGIQKVKSEKPDLVLSDWNMPVMSGIEFLRALRAAGNQTKFGFATPEGTEETRGLALGEGALFLVTAPFTPEAFQQAIGALLSGP